MTCYDCDKEFQAESGKEILDLMHPHYMESHKEIIEGADEEKKAVWMKQFNSDWEAAEEV